MEWRDLAQSTDNSHPRAPKDAPVLIDLIENTEQKQMYSLDAVLPRRIAFLYFREPDERGDVLELAVDRIFNDETTSYETKKLSLVAGTIPTADIRKVVSGFILNPKVHRQYEAETQAYPAAEQLGSNLEAESSPQFEPEKRVER